MDISSQASAIGGTIINQIDAWLQGSSVFVQAVPDGLLTLGLVVMAGYLYVASWKIKSLRKREAALTMELKRLQSLAASRQGRYEKVNASLADVAQSLETERSFIEELMAKLGDDAPQRPT